MSGQTGIKETIYQIFDIVFPADLGNVALGMNEYQELAESFRKLVDVAIEEQDEAVNTYFGDRLELMAAECNALNAQIIEKDAQLQESIRKEQFASENYQRALKENEVLEKTIVDIENIAADRAVENGDLQEQLKAKDEQIAKLTEEINKPKANIVIPSQGKSTNLQQLMEEARNKKVKSALDLALSGQVHRGKVELAIPPSYNGGNEDTESTFQADIEVDPEIRGVHIPEVSIVEAPTPSYEEEKVAGLDEHPIVSEDNGPITWKNLREIEGEIKARILRIEQHVGLSEKF